MRDFLNSLFSKAISFGKSDVSLTLGERDGVLDSRQVRELAALENALMGDERVALSPEQYWLYRSGIPREILNIEKSNRSTRLREDLHHTYGPTKVEAVPGTLFPGKGGGAPNIVTPKPTEFLKGFNLSSIDAVGLISPKTVDGKNFNSKNVSFHFGVCVLVHPQWVLTAHHVIDNIQFAQNYQIRFDYSEAAGDASAVFDASTVAHFSSEKDSFKSSHDGTFGPYRLGFTEDWALIKLYEPQEKRAVMKLRVLNDGEIKNKPEVRIPYFSSALAGEKIQPMHFVTSTPPMSLDDTYQDRGRIVSSSGIFLYHRANATSGASGSPLIAEDGAMVGMHTESPTGKEYNKATNVKVIAEVVAELPT
jgi:hypothetical protein